MIKDVFDSYFANHIRLAFEHRDRFYPNQASAHINKTTHKKLHGQCLRAAYYSCVGISEKAIPKTSCKMIGKIGDYAERMILDMLRSEGALVEPQVKFELPAHNVFGKIDGIVKVEGKEKGLEIKSIGSSKYIVNQIFGSPWSEPTPKWQHLFQTLVYCYAFRERVDEFILLYIRRDTCETKEFVISTFAEGDLIYPVIDGKVDYRFTVNDILERYRLLMQYIEDDKIPERDYVKLYPQDQIPRYVKAGILSKRQAEIYKDAPFGDIECKLCGYADLCDRES